VPTAHALRLTDSGSLAIDATRFTYKMSDKSRESSWTVSGATSR